MLIKRKTIQSNPDTDVVVVRPRQNTGLFVALGVAFLLAVGIVMYLSWYLPRADDGTPDVAIVETQTGRAQSMDDPAPNPNNIIVTPPPVVNTQPPVVNTPPPVIVTPPQDRTIIVEGRNGQETPPPPTRNDGGGTDNGTDPVQIDPPPSGRG